jgi:hypothetical protein
MDLSILFENKYLIALSSSVGGIILTLLTQQILNKRGLFTYFVAHNRVGVSADDAIYGSVRVTWNDNPIAHLFMSTVELINRSTKDYESVIVRVFTNDTALLTERTEIVGTIRIAEFTESYVSQLIVPEGHEPTEAQQNLYRSQRDYMIPTMNRGQVVRFQYLNAAHSEAQPSIWLDILHKGVKLKFQVARNVILGVPQPTAAIAGTGLGVVFVGLVIAYSENVFAAAVPSFLFGLIAQIPGAYAVRLWWRFRDWSAG